MTRVKICGLTRLEDAQAAIAAGADALGFILWPGSKRNIGVNALRDLLRQLPPLVQTVGVFVNETPANIVAIRLATGLGTMQLHGDEKPEDYAGLAAPVIKAFRQPPSTEELAAWRVNGFLADGAAAGSYGGSGHLASDDVVHSLAATGRLILAGGLTPDTVAERIRAVRPYGVDVASGVETAPGIKDANAIHKFVAAAKGA